MKATQWKTQATVERAWESGIQIDEKATISFGRLGIVGHTATIDNELVCNLVSVWDEEALRSSRACGCGGESWAGVDRDVVTRERG